MKIDRNAMAVLRFLDQPARRARFVLQQLMTDAGTIDRGQTAVTLWLDPVCPFSWNTARWLKAAADEAGFAIDWQLMNLALLNDGRELPPPQRARMTDSQRVGRLMAALREELGQDAIATAYFAFGEEYFDRSRALGDEIVEHVLRAVGARRTTAAAVCDTELDAVVSRCHQASQDALGETGGSPLITIDGHTAFGPVFTSVPTADRTLAVFDAVKSLVLTPQFSQLHRPRAHA